MGHLSHHKSTPDQVCMSGWLLSALISFPQTITLWIPLVLLFSKNRKQLSLESQRKHIFSHFLKIWLCNIFSLQIHKIWCPNKIVLFFQEMLKHFKNHRWAFLADIWQYKTVSWQNAWGEKKTVCRAHLRPWGLPKETRGEHIQHSGDLSPHWRSGSEEPVSAANRRLLCFGPKETGFIPGHPRSERPRLNRGLCTWPMITLVFRNAGKCSWTQITSSILWPRVCVPAMCT